jgi:hypothetical protein
MRIPWLIGLLVMLSSCGPGLEAPPVVVPPGFVPDNGFRIANYGNRNLRIMLLSGSSDCGMVTVGAGQARLLPICGPDPLLEIDDSQGSIVQVPISAGGQYEIQNRNGRWVILPSI